MIGHFFIFVLLAFQQKKAVPPESAERKFLEERHERSSQGLLDALTANNECVAKRTKTEDHPFAAIDACDRIYKPLMSKFQAENELITAQLAKVDECKKTYRTTIDKRTSDLTVREATAVKACQALALYPLEMPPPPQKRPVIMHLTNINDLAHNQKYEEHDIADRCNEAIRNHHILRGISRSDALAGWRPLPCLRLR